MRQKRLQEQQILNKKNEKYPDNYLVMNKVKVEIEKLEEDFEHLKNYERSKDKTLEKRIKDKLGECKLYL